MNNNPFLEMEQKYHLYEDKIDGVNYWIYARPELCEFYFPWLQGKIPKEVHGRLKSPINFIKKIPDIVINVFFKGIIKAKPANVCIINHERRIFENEIYECKYTTELYNYLGEEAIVLERPYNFGHLRPINEKKIVYLDYISVMCTFYYWIVLVFKKKKYEYIYLQVKERMKKPLVEINQFYQIDCSLDNIAKKITKVIFLNKVRLKQVRKLIEKISPKVIVEVVGYDATCMAINEVAHDMNIKTYELQHGTIYKDEFTYNYNNRSAILQFADYFLVFGDYWKKGIKYPIDESHVISVGFPYMEKKVKKIKNDRIENEDKQFQTLLFLSQGTIGRQMSLLACELIKLIEKKINIKIIYKLHPGEFLIWEKRYPELKDMEKRLKIQVIDTHISNLYDLFSQADIQIGVNSTAIIEGLAFGLTTIIYDIGEDTCMNDLCEHNLVYRTNSAEGIMDILLTDKKRTENANIELFWKSNAINNMVEVINGDKLKC